MENLAFTLFMLPFLGGAAVFVTKGAMREYLSSLVVFVLAIVAVASYFVFDSSTLIIGFNPIISDVLMVFDFALFAYFMYQGLKNRDTTILLLSSLQLVLLLIFVLFGEVKSTPQISIDKLSIMMYLLINIAGGVIVLYALGYMKDEDTSESKRSYFLALLLAFLGVMNLIVSCDNLEWFFLSFELTTLFSFLLIGFRKDEVSRANALTALRLNLFGGAALALMIVICGFFIGTLSISSILSMQNSYLIMFVFALFSFAAIVKGAQPPFSSWLLGAMVAPTPVSAILHSSTMVKIAPFMMLKISYALHGSFFAKILSLFLLASFLFSAILALKEDSFKKILAYSTISLLALMMALALYGTAAAISASMLLIVFHGISKALLFLQAGILEKTFHVKSVEDFGGLWQKSRTTAFLILFGFLSIVIPPFGAFLAKWLALESFSASSGIYMALSVVSTALGGVVLTLLYFKVNFKLAISTHTMDKRIGLRFWYKFSSWFFAFLLAIFALLVAPITADFFAPIAESISKSSSHIRSAGLNLFVNGGSFYFWEILLTFALMTAFALLSFFAPKSSADISSSYYCAEKKELKLSAFYFIDEAFERKAVYVFAFSLAAILIIGVAL